MGSGDARGYGKGGKMSAILLVDDNHALLDVLKQMLELQGHETICATSAYEALAMLAVHCPDIVITDIDMPGMDGVSLTERLRRERPGMPVVAHSAMLPTNAEALFDAVLEKPATFDEITSALDVCARQPYAV